MQTSTSRRCDASPPGAPFPPARCGAAPGRSRGLWAGSIPALLLLSACGWSGPALGVDPVEELLESAAPPSGSAPTSGFEASDSGEGAGVWSLDGILAEISRANPTLGRAQAHLEEAQALLAEARAAYYPEVSLGLDYVATDNPGQAFGLLLNQEKLELGPSFDATPGWTENWRKELRLDWPLFRPGRTEGVDAAREGSRAAELAGRAAERRLLNAGIQAWIGLGVARRLEDVARSAEAVVERRLEETRSRWEAGAAVRADVLRLEARLAGSRQATAQAALAATKAESALARLMGRAAGTPLELSPEQPVVGSSLPEELEELLDLARSQRLDLLAAAHRVRMAQYSAEAVRAARLPRLGLFAAYDIDGNGPGIDTDLDSGILGIGLRLPLSARSGPRTEAARARARAARAELDRLALEVTQEVRDGWEELHVAEQSVEWARTAATAAEEAFRIVSEAQDAGGATVTDVLEAEDARRQAQMREVVAQAGVALARAKLVAATGGVR